MKIIGRTLIILAAALVVVGITFAIGRSSGAAGTNTGRPRGQFVPGQPGGPPGRGFPEGRGPDGAGAPWYFGLMEVGKNLVILGVIVTVGTLSLGRMRRRRPAPVPRKQQAPPNPM
jgi:hypothetical protein